MELLSKFSSLEQRSQDAIGIFTSTINKLRGINEEADAKESVNNTAIEALLEKKKIRDQDNKALHTLRTENNNIIDKIAEIIE